MSIRQLIELRRAVTSTSFINGASDQEGAMSALLVAGRGPHPLSAIFQDLRRRLEGLRLVWLALLSLTLASVSSADPRKAEEIALVATGAADIISTELALRDGGFEELNPLVQSAASRIAIKSGATAGMILLARHLEKHGNPGAARILRWSGIVAWATATGWNVSLMVRY